MSNVPVLFEAAPMVRALFPAGLAVVALVVGPHPPNPPLPTRRAPSPGEGGTGRLEIVRLVVIFLVLVWLDSAAFAIVQANRGLKAQTWGTAGQKVLQGSVHLVAAVGAGALLDAGFGLVVPLAAWVLFAIAFPLLQQPGGSVVAGPLYAVGISLYSTALVVMPTWRAPSSLSPRWRAGLLYGIAGWLGSALGVGMAQDLGRIPTWFLLATGATLATVFFLLSGSPLARGGGAEGRERGVRGVRALGALSATFFSSLFGLGIDYGIYVADRFEELLADGLERRAALVRAVRELGPGLLTGTITSAVAFYGMVFSGFRGFAELGIIGGTGLLVALFFMTSLLPALLMLFGGGRRRRERRLTERRAGRFLAAVQHPALAIALTVAVLAGLGLFETPYLGDFAKQGAAGALAEAGLEVRATVRPLPGLFVIHMVTFPRI